MWIQRDFERNWRLSTSLPVKILRGVRQCGKSALLQKLGSPSYRHITLDDLQARQGANQDPALFFEQYPWPLIIDEVQYAPPLFPEIKKRVDLWRHSASKKKETRLDSPLWLTGSNQILLDREVRESLAGRASYFTLHPLSVAELHQGHDGFSLKDCFLKGGWPELYVTPSLSPVEYLNNYLLTYIEKDIVLSAGLLKTKAFEMALGLLGARVATLLNASEIAGAVGVQTVTVQDWLGLLERNQLVFMLPGYFSNLSKRLIKSPRLYFMDTGLASRLQGWGELDPLLKSPQAGFLFENLVLSEIVKTRDFFRKDWSIFYYRTKEGEEVDFIVEDSRKKVLALEAKLAVQSVPNVALPPSFKKIFPQVSMLGVVTFAGEKKKLGQESLQIPLVQLRDYLLENLG